jgi:hypothetical protein
VGDRRGCDDAQVRWRRVGVSDEMQLAAAVITSIVSLVVVGLVLYVLAQPWPGNLLEAGIFAVFVAVMWRIVLAGPGTYVGEAGILNRRWLWGGQVVPWSDIHRVRLIDDPQWHSLMIVIVKRDGTFVRLPWGLRGPVPPGMRFMSMAEMYPHRAQAMADELDRLAAERNGRVPLD